ncbi:hypothetical protein O1W68_01650 [Rhodococcus sp. H36-A4]|uniref:hypothetical protein n=1 Tax=Rhodococcus sp. H36-A4 TaxID=3004353 RepID=UPI0022AFAAF9|nr:hypothetical protein [Rhodococcus sp. H36-A4]MCZ4076636.1 hypothetical protein [Rhodococcus sp. H36-A4]
MTLFELLPSLSGAARPRFDPTTWPVTTRYHRGRLTFDGMAAEDVADCMGTPAVFHGVLVTRSARSSQASYGSTARSTTWPTPRSPAGIRWQGVSSSPSATPRSNYRPTFGQVTF